MNTKEFLFFVLLAFSTPAVANEAQKLMMQLPPDKQAYALGHIVETSDQHCSSASRAFYQGSDKKGNAFWSVQCASHLKYSVMIFNDAKGSTKVLACGALKAIANVGCFEKFKK